MKSVLLTGASGFIGRQSIAPLLTRNFKVHCVTSREPSGAPAGGVEWHLADLLDAQATNAVISRLQPTHLLHFAWVTQPGSYWTSAANLTWVQASLSLIQSFQKFGGQRMVIAGTCAEYDGRYGYCTEGVTPAEPATLYGVAKNTLRLLLDAYARQVSLSTAWGRLFFTYGPFEASPRLVPSVITSLLKGEVARCTHGRQIRDWLHVADVADAFVTLLDSDLTGSVNIASGEPVAIRDVILRIAKQFGQPDRVQFGALPARDDDPPMLVGNSRRLAQDLKWKANYALDEGLANTIQWWKQHYSADKRLT